MVRLRLGPAAIALLATATALADGGAGVTTVQQIRSAAAEYDAGRRAFVEKDYDGAAAHFENAFNDAPSAEALRNAIRAHRKSGHLARAATLAEVASQRYPRDAPTAAVVRDTLAESAHRLHKVTLRCTPDCGVVADGRAISLSDSATTVFFLDPGSHDLAVSWSGDRSTSQKVAARAGGRDEILLEAPPAPPPPPVMPVIAPSVVVPVAQPAQVDTLADRPSKPFGPVVFLVGAALTAGGIGFVAWSGVDAENHPGAAAVMAQCAGMGPTCPAYQQGLAAQLRTNIALGVTGGVALATGVVGIFFTQWSSPQPRTTPLALQPTADVLPGGASLGLSGRF